MSSGGTDAPGAVRRRVALGLAVLTAAGLLTVAGSGSAESASCTGRKVRTLSFSTGSVHVYKRGRWVCAVTVAKSQDTYQWMSVSVQARGNRPVIRRELAKDRVESDIVHAGRRCVWVESTVGESGVSKGWILC